jgi:hypothetical protein
MFADLDCRSVAQGDVERRGILLFPIDALARAAGFILPIAN